MDLGKDNVFKLLLGFSIPAITGMLVNALYNMVDRIFISYGVGATAFSSLSVTGPITTVLLAFSMLVGIGAATQISLRMGANDIEGAERTLGNAFLMLLITSFVVMLAGEAFLTPVLLLFGASPGTLPYATQYMRIILLGFPFVTCGFGCFHMTRASGSPTLTMYGMLLGAILNIILDAIFIFIFGWGVAGAAVATIISQGVAMFWVLSFFLGGRGRLRLKLKNFKPDKEILTRIYAIGISPFLNQIAISGIGAFVNNLLVFYGGDDALGAYGAVQMVTMLFLMPVFGLNQGTQPIVGFNYGAKKYGRMRKAMGYSASIAFAIGCIGWLIAHLLTIPLINLFTNGYEGINQYAVPALRTMTLFFPLGAVQIVCSVFFQAVGRAKTTLFLGLLRQVLLLVPLYYILAHLFGLDGIWYSMPATDIVSFLITMPILYFGFRNIKEENAEEPLTDIPAQ